MLSPEVAARRLAVLAHYDPTGHVADHVERRVDALAAAFDDVVVVTTAPLRPEARERLTAGPAHLVERENVGYDFFSYRAGLETAGDPASYGEVLLCNDSWIGPLRDHDRLRADMAGRPADFWGLTASSQRLPHVQSYFVCFRRPVLEAPEFREFWTGLQPLNKRWQVVRRHEIGLSERLHAAGFGSAAYFEPDADDERVARQRQAWVAAHRAGVPRGRAALRELRQRAAQPSNPTLVLADRALDAGRLPLVKVEVLRHDPFRLGAGRLLELCEERFPEAFAGVRRHLELTAAHYPARPEDVLPRRPVLERLAGPLVRYR